MYLNYRELDAHIIIIGAGIAGLSAAYHLLEKDPHIDLLILDVNDEPESTIKKQFLTPRYTRGSNYSEVKKKTRFADDNFQSDYQFIHSKQTNLIDLLDKLEIQTIRSETSYGNILVDYDEIYEVPKKENISIFLNTDERIILKIFFKQIDRLCTLFSFGKSNVLPEFDKISMSILLDRLITSKKVRDVISQTFLFNSGLRPNDVSAAFFLAYCHSTQGIEPQFIWNEDSFLQFSIEGGVENIRYKMLEMISGDYIIRVPKITEISWDDFCAGIKTPHDCFFAKKVIFTLNKNEMDDITFVPPLPDEKRRITGDFVRGILKKFIINYSEPFWVNKGLSGEVYVLNDYERNGPVYLCLNVSMKIYNDYTLVGLAKEECDKMEILNQLKLYFGEEALNPKNYVESSSSLNDLTFPYGCKSMKCFETIQNNTERIVWANPETATKWYGTAAGSLEAGCKGALKALQEIRPSMLSLEDLLSISPNEVHIPPRRMGIYGIQWHFIVPTFLIIIYAIVRLKRYISLKISK